MYTRTHSFPRNFDEFLSRIPKGVRCVLGILANLNCVLYLVWYVVAGSMCIISKECLFHDITIIDFDRGLKALKTLSVICGSSAQHGISPSAAFKDCLIIQMFLVLSTGVMRLIVKLKQEAGLRHFFQIRMVCYASLAEQPLGTILFVWDALGYDQVQALQVFQVCRLRARLFSCMKRLDAEQARLAKTVLTSNERRSHTIRLLNYMVNEFSRIQSAYSLLLFALLVDLAMSTGFWTWLLLHNTNQKSVAPATYFYNASYIVHNVVLITSLSLITSSFSAFYTNAVLKVVHGLGGDRPGKLAASLVFNAAPFKLSGLEIFKLSKRNILRLLGVIVSAALLFQQTLKDRPYDSAHDEGGTHNSSKLP